MNFINVSTYAGDAIVMQLTLLGGDSVIHDWNYILTSLNILSWTPQIAFLLYGVGIICVGVGITYTLSSVFNQESQAVIWEMI